MHARFTFSLLRVALLVSLAVLACSAWADTIELTSGSKFEGRLISRDAQYVTFEVQIGQIKIERRFPAAEVAKLIVAGQDASLYEPSVQDASSDVTAVTDQPQKESSDEDAVPATMPVGPSYFLVPVRGELGRDVDSKAFRRCLDLARKLKPKPNAVILDLSTSGGSSSTLLEIMDAVADWQSKESVPLVALVRRDSSLPATLIAMCVRDIYMTPNARIGAISSLLPSDDIVYQGAALPRPAVEEPSAAIVQKKAHEFAEHAGHNPLLVDAMLSSEQELWVVMGSDGKPTVVQGPLPMDRQPNPAQPPTLLVRQGSLLVLTDAQAINIGLVSGVAMDYDQLGTALDWEGWVSISNMAEKIMASHEAKNDRIKELYAQYSEGVAFELSRQPDPIRYPIFDVDKLAELEALISNLKAKIIKIERLVNDNSWLAEQAARDFPGGFLSMKAKCDDLLILIRKQQHDAAVAKNISPDQSTTYKEPKKVRTVTVQRGSPQRSSRSSSSGSSGSSTTK